MKLSSTITTEEISATLQQQSERVYGSERTAELAGMIESTSAAMAEIAKRELLLRDAAPEIGSPDGQVGR